MAKTRRRAASSRCVDKRYGSLSLEAASDDGAPELTIYKESFVSVKDDYLPDALAPFSGKLTLLADRNAVCICALRLTMRLLPETTAIALR